jgi:transcriptional regulator with XRE-family HTH domain
MSDGIFPASGPASEDVIQLGRVLRETRVAARLSVEALAAAAGVSAGSISQLERGRGNPSFLTLRRLATALQVPLGHFLQGPETSQLVVRADQRKRLRLPTEPGLVYELLTPGLGGELEVLRSQIPPGFDNRHQPFRHAGEECVHLLSGTLLVGISGRQYEMNEGDSITYDSSIPHYWVNASGAVAVIIGAVTPPSF